MDASSASLLGDITLAPRDPILGVTEAFNADSNPRKVNLGVGVYCNDEGKVPLLECVKRAEVAGRTVTLKVKFRDFTIITRSKSFSSTIPDLSAFAAAGQSLLSALYPLPKGIRLLGLGLHNLTEVNAQVPAQLGLAI